MRINNIIAGFLFAFIGVALPQAVIAADAAGAKGAAPASRTVSQQELDKTPPSATLSFEAEQLRLIFGGASGHGVLHYQGKDYKFTMKGASAGGVGYNKVEGTGTVHFLKSLNDFAGRYSGIGAGATVGGGASKSSFQNEKGVIVSTKSKSTGLALTLGVSSVEVTLVK